MRIDNHTHIGIDPFFYTKGWFPYCLDFQRLVGEAEGTGIDRWVVFPFASYFGMKLDTGEGVPSPAEGGCEIPYALENRRLFGDIRRMGPELEGRFLPFLMADPGRMAAEQVRGWKSMAPEARGIKIQATVIRAPIVSLLEGAACMLDFAEENDLPFLIHTSIDPADAWSQCADILRVVETRPRIRFVLAHSCRFHRPSLDRVAELPNAWFDCSAHIIHCRCAQLGLPAVAREAERFPADYSSPRKVLAALAEAYPDKLIWGSDAPFYSYADSAIQLESTYREEAAALAALRPDLNEKAALTNTLAWLGRDK